jgi:hypothetical protein
MECFLCVVALNEIIKLGFEPGTGLSYRRRTDAKKLVESV